MSNNQLSSGFKMAGLSFTSNQNQKIQSPTTNSSPKDEKQSKPKTILNFLWGASPFPRLVQDLVEETVDFVESCFLVKQHYHQLLADMIFDELETNWTKVYVKQYQHISQKLDIDVVNNPKVVMFKKPKGYVIYKKENRIIHMQSYGKHHIYLITPTIGFDVDLFITDVIKKYEEKQIKITKATHWNRYRIAKFIGAEKNETNISFLPLRDDREYGEVDDSGIYDNSVDSIHSNIDLEKDNSFMYEKHRYNFDKPIKDNFENLYYPSQILKCVERAQKWFKMQDWYNQRMLPWKLGMCFHGVGGTGKSEMAKSIAKDISVPLYQFYLNTMTDREFIQFWEEMETPCVALFEDFDNVFHGRISQTEHKSLTFDCVLNQLSGVSSSQGILLIVTTNDISKIDSAMGVGTTHGNISTRPGRIDMVVEFPTMDLDNRIKLANRVLSTWPECIETMVEKGDGMTPAQFQELCIQFAVEKLHSETNEVI